MSLLLEALKKAELAKQGTQPEPAPERAAEPPAQKTGPSAEELTLVQEPREPVITRENLPDISPSMEIRSEDLPSTARNAEQSARRAAERGAQPALERPDPALSEPAGAAGTANGSGDGARETATAQMRDAARQVFDVKEVDYNPRRPFYFTIAALLVAGIGYGGYVWWQMQPHYAVNAAAVNVAAAPKRPDAAASAAGESTPAQPVPAPAPTQPTASAQPTAVPAPKPIESPPEAQAKPAPVAAPTFRAAREGAVRATQPDARRSEPPARRGDAAQPPISILPATVQPDPALQAAYSSYGRGEWQTAHEQYQRVLERDPGNRDALLGLAAIDVRERSYETAELRYLKLLELNPRDTYAFAGLLALQGNVDPVQSESRIKSLLATQPESTHLYFTLGNQYAAQGRWGEAQGAYFKAYASNPQNPDYAFNLAVSLDHLRQPRLALEYYRKALAVAQQQPAAFSRAQAEARATELER